MERWRIRNGILSLLSKIPAGENLYQLMQKYFGQFNNEDFVRNKIHEINDIILFACNKGIDIKGLTIIELGTGWVPLAPVLLSLYGAQSVTSIDLNHYYIPSLLKKATAAIINTIQNNENSFPIRMDQNKIASLKKYRHKPDKILKALAITLLSPVDARDTCFNENSFDLYFSMDTLEHISPDDLELIFKESRRIVGPGGYFLHSIDLADHFSYDDSNLSSIYFLCHSDKEWARICNRYTYHNRLRKNEFKALIQRSRFKIISKIEEIDQRALNELKDGLQLHDDYSGEKHDELCVNRITYLMTSLIS